MGNVKVRSTFLGLGEIALSGNFKAGLIFRRRKPSPPRWKPQANRVLVQGSTRGFDGCLWSFRKSDLWRNLKTGNWNYDGSGTLFSDKQLAVYQGDFKNGQFSGTGKQFNENGVLLYRDSSVMDSITGKEPYFVGTDQNTFPGNGF